jgi:hypothetical protein
MIIVMMIMMIRMVMMIMTIVMIMIMPQVCDSLPLSLSRGKTRQSPSLVTQILIHQHQRQHDITRRPHGHDVFCPHHIPRMDCLQVEYQLDEKKPTKYCPRVVLRFYLGKPAWSVSPNAPSSHPACG